MCYYRIAVQVAAPPTWQWKSTVLSELSALLKVLRPYLVLPHDRVRVFASSSREDLHEPLGRESTDLRSCSLTATQFLQKMGFSSREVGEGIAIGGRAEHQETTSSALTPQRSPSDRCGEAQVVLDACRGWSLEQRRMELEQGAGGDHDLPYQFTLPTWIPQVVAWATLLTKVQSGAIQP
jgi:hypothetical protein